MKRISALSWWTWSLAVLFLFYEFFIRVFPTVMVGDLMAAFSVTAGSLGALSAFFFYAYAPMQIPVGLLMDRYGARWLLSIAALLCGIGCFFFGTAAYLSIAELGRFLMGIGSAFAFVGMVYVCSHFFPARKLALLVGVGNSIGMVGAVGALGPLSFAVDSFGWRFSVNAFGYVGIALAIILFIFIRKEPRSFRKKETPDKLIKSLKIVSTNSSIWLNGIIALLTFMTTAAFASLWGIPFLMKSYGISDNLAGFIVSMIFVGWIVGGPIIGMVSDRFSKRKPFLYIGILFTIVTLLPVLYLPGLPVWLLFTLLFLVGFFQSAELLNFSLAIELTPIKVKGTSIAVTNFIVAVGSSIMQPLLGVFLDWGWDGRLQGGVPLYSLRNYHLAMASFPVTLVLSFILLLFLKEPKRKKDKETFSEIIGRD
ncbi:MAG: Membrane sensor protein UhpC [Chlamydiae bacterium]|nr:Membrane sensor protein UhpC [Chlamydiota bacterium]